MNSTRLIIFTGAFTALALLGAQGCSNDSESGTGGSGGSTGGKGGSGTGGKSGSGTGGSSGTTGGTGGSGGKGGTGGSSGTTGGTGTGGTADGSAGTGGSGGTGTDGSSEGGAIDSCASYCSNIATICTGTDTQYSAGADTTASCMGSCNSFPAGTPGATSGDSQACRFTHLGFAATLGTNPHCDHAGPAGAFGCGQPCQGYCSIMMSVCSSAFATNQDCMNSCTALSDATTLTNYDATANAALTSGATLACRLYHATLAAVSASFATTHCPHAAGTSLCI